MARGYPPEVLVFGTLTHKSPHFLEVGSAFSNIISGRTSSILAECLRSCQLVRGLLYELVESLGYIVLGSVCEEHIDNKSQFCRRQNVASTSSRTRPSSTSSSKSVLLTSVISLDRLIANQLRKIYSETQPRRNGFGSGDSCWARADAPPTCGSAFTKGGGEPSEFTACANSILLLRNSLTGMHLVQTSQRRELPGRRHAQKPQAGSATGNTQACAAFGSTYIPQIFARVKQICEWITMWRSLDGDTKNIIRRLWRMIMPGMCVHQAIAGAR